MQNLSTERFYSLLFDEGEWTCFATPSFKANTTNLVDDHVLFNHQNWKVFTINPLIKGRKKSQSNVKHLRTFFFESDTLTLEEQRDAIQKSGLPYSACVFSGNKSLHYFVTLKQPIKEREQYDAIWRAIQVTLEKSGYDVDDSVKDPVKFARMPEAKRAETGKIQTLAKLNDRISLETLEHWFLQNDVHWQDYLPKKRELTSTEGVSDATLDEKAEWLKKHFMKNDRHVQGNMYNYQLKFSILLIRAGVRHEDEIRLVFRKDSDISGRIDKRLKFSKLIDQFKDEDPIYVYSNEERKKYIREQEKLRLQLEADARRALMKLEVEEGSEPPTIQTRPSRRQFFRDINNYIHVNNGIYRKDYDDPDKLNPETITKSTFKSKHGFFEEDYIDLPEYDGFINVPNILEYQQEIGGKWNTFGRVRHTPKKGKWPTIEKLLRHHFGQTKHDHDQYDMILEWLRVLILYPTMRQQGIILFSKKQRTAKSAFALLCELLVGEINFSKIKDDELESDFNQLWVSSLVINLDEPFFQNKKKMTKIIREMITAKKQNLRKMREDYTKVNFYAKVVVTTNDTDFMEFEINDRRYWVRESPQIEEKDLDPYFEDKIKEEIPYFLYFLINEMQPVFQKKQDTTFWLPQSITLTRSFKKVCGDSAPQLSETLRLIIEDWFIQNQNQNELKFTMSDIIFKIQTQIDGGHVMGLNSKKIQNIDIAKCLRDQLHCDVPEKTTRVSEKDAEKTLNKDTGPGRWYTAYRKNFHIDLEKELFDHKM